MNVDRDLAAIQSSVSASIPDFQLVVLCGSYGRGDGALVPGPGGMMPYNDYDLVIVSDAIPPRRKQVALLSALQQSCSLKTTDIKYYRTRNLRRLRPTVFNFDLKYGSSFLAGNRSLLVQIPEFASADIPLREVLVLFLTRLWTLLGCATENHFQSGVEGPEARHFRYQLAKAVFAASDALLIDARQYTCRYADRVHRVSRLGQGIIPPPMLAWALDSKRMPSADPLTPNEMWSLYDDVAAIFLKCMREVLSRYFVGCTKESLSLAEHYRRHPGTLLRRALYPIRHGHSFENTFNLNMAQIHLAEAYTGGRRIDRSELSKAVARLNRVRPELGAPESWHAAREIAAQLRLQN